MQHAKSEAAFEEAKQYIPGGVNSPVRSFRSVGGVPPIIAGGAGSKLTDIDGNEYIDYVLSYGPLLLGHAHPVVTEAIKKAAEKGSSYGAPTLAETELAKLVCRLVPSMDMVRMVNSGTEATMSALRLARAYTGRDNIVKFIGCYHGHQQAAALQRLAFPTARAYRKTLPPTPLPFRLTTKLHWKKCSARRAKPLPPLLWNPPPATWALCFRMTATLPKYAKLPKNTAHSLSAMKLCPASAPRRAVRRAYTASTRILPA